MHCHNIAISHDTLYDTRVKQCNSKTIFKTVDNLLSNKQKLENQVLKSQGIIKNFKTEKSSEIASSVLLNHL